MTADLAALPVVPAWRPQPEQLTPELRRVRRLRVPTPAIIALAYLCAALFTLWRVWQGLSSSVLPDNQDQAMMEWFFAYDAHVLTHLQNPFFTTLQNYPTGFNGMANTLLLGLGIPLAPITLAFGPTATFALTLTLGMASTAFGWYWVFQRHLRLHQVAAVVGGAVCGFGPAIVSHAHGHVNFVFGALLPWIAIRLIRAGATTRPWRDGVYLGLLVSWQIFIGEEPLLLFAFGCVVFGLGLLGFDFQRTVAWARRVFRPVAVGVAVTLAITGVPIWWQYFGPQSYGTLDHTGTSNDLLEFVQFPEHSVGNLLWTTERLSTNPTELSAYYGLLLPVVVAAIVVMWGRPLVRAAALAIGVMVVLSLGPTLDIAGHHTGIPLPWAALREIPPLSTIVELRFAGACLPLIAMVIAMAIDRILRSKDRDVRILGLGALAVALVPLVPTPLDVVPRPPVPGFISHTMWQKYVHGGSVVFAPLPGHSYAEPLRWQAAADFGFPMASGYFVGPNVWGVGSHYPDPNFTSELLKSVYESGTVPPITDADRLEFITDLQDWHADVVVLPHTVRDRQMYDLLTALFSRPGTYLGDVWVWQFDLKGAATG